MRRLSIGAAICALAAASAAAAREESERASGSDAPPPDHDAPLPDGDDPREPPDYDGRGEEPTSAGDVLLWAPRVVSFPLYVMSEYVIRRPVGAVVKVIEEYHLPAKYHEFFTFGERDQIGIFPTGIIDLGFRPTLGIYSYWRSRDERTMVRLRATTGGLDLWTVNAMFGIPLGDRDRLRVSFDYAWLPDRAFFGLGSEGREDPARYREERVRGRVTYTYERRPFSISSYMGLLSASFDPGHRDLGDPSLAEAVAAGIFTAPPGLEDGVLALQTGLSMRIDTHTPRVTPPPRSVGDLSIEAVAASPSARTSSTTPGSARHEQLQRTKPERQRGCVTEPESPARST